MCHQCVGKRCFRFRIVCFDPALDHIRLGTLVCFTPRDAKHKVAWAYDRRNHWRYTSHAFPTLEKQPDALYSRRFFLHQGWQNTLPIPKPTSGHRHFFKPPSHHQHQNVVQNQISLHVAPHPGGRAHPLRRRGAWRGGLRGDLRGHEGCPPFPPLKGESP